MNNNDIPIPIQLAIGSLAISCMAMLGLSLLSSKDAEAQVVRALSAPTVREITVSDGSRCILVHSSTGSVALSCNWKPQ